MSQQAVPATEQPKTARAWTLVRRPKGWPVAEDFELAELSLPELGAGQILVANEFFSVDPYMRGRMNDVKSYVPPFQLGQPMDGGAVGRVLASTADGFQPGDSVLHQQVWRDHAGPDAAQAVKVDPELAPSSTYLGALGMTGLTAYAGLLRVGGLKEGDTVFVSGAAGAVGSMVGQIAKLRGAAKVIGSAGSPEKVRKLVEEYGFDEAFDYKQGPVAEQLRKAAPDGIDVYFDNVGGDHLEAAIGSLKVHGRVVECGMIAQYNATEPPAAPRNLALVIGKRLRIEGLLVRDHFDLQPEFVDEVGGWLREGRIAFDETVVDGIDRAVDAFLGLLRGENIGKMLVRV
jgi:NADPH-dependent curcumin reductase CurA